MDTPRTDLLQKPHASALADFGLDAMLGFELGQEFFSREFSGEDIGLPFHCGEVAWAQLIQL